MWVMINYVVAYMNDYIVSMTKGNPHLALLYHQSQATHVASRGRLTG